MHALTAEYVKLARYADCVLQHHTERILYQLWRDVRSIKERLGMEQTRIGEDVENVENP